MIGNGHVIAQDYSIHGSSYVGVFDGCSGENYSDVGARLLGHRVDHVLKFYGPRVLGDYDLFGKAIIVPCVGFADSMSIPRTCLNASIVVAFQLDDEIIVRIYGDGMFRVKLRNGDTQTIVINYPSKNNQESPYYLTYWYLGYESYYKQQKNKKLICYTNDQPVAEVLMDSLAPIERKYKIEDIEWIAIASDGFDTFYHSGEKTFDTKISVVEVFKTMTTFPVINEGFVQRRLKRGSEKYRIKDIIHFDDISMGVLVCDMR
jgi:hypothetical protein